MTAARQDVIAVAMSGGVDSSVAAALLSAANCEIFGVTARMTVEHSRCCSDEDMERAGETAERLGIRHHVVDVCDPFKETVIEYFVSEYLSGRTPSPCVTCNRVIKFGWLLEKSLELGATKFATGHYARIERHDNGVGLSRGADRAKDQSYFLSRLSQHQLAHTVLPLGDMPKQRVAAYAAEHRLPARESRESQELCFVTEGTHGDYIELRSFATRGPGDIVDTEGSKLGTHRGIHHYTIGQRKGLGVAVGRPVYVASLDAERNVVVVGDRAAVMRREMRVADVLWINGTPAKVNFRALCQIRYNHQGAECDVALQPGGGVRVVFEEPQFAITPGQLAAFYEGDGVIGAGWIV